MANVLHASTALAAFMRATAGDLPEPHTVQVFVHNDHPEWGPKVQLSFRTLDDLRQWAQMLAVQVESRRTHMGTFHHNLDATWPAHDGTAVGFTSCFIERPETVECSSEMEVPA